MVAQESSSRSSTSAVDKALNLIEAVSFASEPIRLTDVAHQVGLHRATAHRVLADLVERGWVLRHNERYLPGPVLLQLSRTGYSHSLIALARPFLESLARASSMMVNLQVLEQDGSRIIDVVQPERLTMINHLNGQWLPVHRFAGTLALVASLQEPARFPYLAVAEREGYPMEGSDGLRGDIARVQQVGYAFSRGRNEDIIGSMSAVARAKNGQPVCALTLISLESEFSDSSLQGLWDLLKETVSGLERELDNPHAHEVSETAIGETEIAAAGAND